MNDLYFRLKIKKACENENHPYKPAFLLKNQWKRAKYPYLGNKKAKIPIFFVSILWFLYVKVGRKRCFCEFSYGLELVRQITPKACMESMQSIVWNPLQDGMESSRRKCTFGDSMRLRRYHTRWRVITYQACGLNKKIDKSKLVDFLAGAEGLLCLRAKPFRGSDSHLGCHSLPLPFKSASPH